jgi:hypothetical protein
MRNDQAYYNTGVEVVNSEEVGLAPGVNFMKPFRPNSTDKPKFCQIKLCSHDLMTNEIKNFFFGNTYV